MWTLGRESRFYTMSESTCNANQYFASPNMWTDKMDSKLDPPSTQCSLYLGTGRARLEKRNGRLSYRLGSACLASTSSSIFACGRSRDPQQQTTHLSDPIQSNPITEALPWPAPRPPGRPSCCSCWACCCSSGCWLRGGPPSARRWAAAGRRLHCAARRRYLLWGHRAALAGWRGRQEASEDAGGGRRGWARGNAR